MCMIPSVLLYLNETWYARYFSNWVPKLKADCNDFRIFGMAWTSTELHIPSPMLLTSLVCSRLVKISHNSVNNIVSKRDLRAWSTHLFTLIWPLPCMHASMLLHGTAGREALAAEVTLIWLLPCESTRNPHCFGERNLDQSHREQKAYPCVCACVSGVMWCHGIPCCNADSCISSCASPGLRVHADVHASCPCDWTYVHTPISKICILLEMELV